MQTDVVRVLGDFIDKAMAQHKYAESSARGLRAALKLFAPYLNDTELTSFDTILDNIDNITIDIYQKQTNDNMTSVTLLVYKRRISKLVRDYKKYGRNPAKMVEWNPRRAEPALAVKRVEVPAVRAAEEPLLDDIAVVASGHKTNRSQIYLRPDMQCRVELPTDLTPAEAAKLQRYIELMVGVDG